MGSVARQVAQRVQQHVADAAEQGGREFEYAIVRMTTPVLKAELVSAPHTLTEGQDLELGGWLRFLRRGRPFKESDILLVYRLRDEVWLGFDLQTPDDIGGATSTTNIKTITADHVVDPTDGVLIGNCTSNDIVITLPPAASVKGQQFTFKRLVGGAHVITVTPNASGETIDDSPNVQLTKQYQGLRVISTGTKWIIPSTVDAKHNPIAAFSVVMTYRAASITNLSTDPNGLSLTYLWNFGDGTTSTAANPAHGYASDGTYTITLTATNSDGLTSTVTHDVTATPPPPNRVPFAATAPFNKPLAQLYPAGVPISPLNDTFIDAIRTPTSLPGTAPYHHLSSDTTQFTVPVYVVDVNTTPLHSVAFSGRRGESTDTGTTVTTGPGVGTNVPIPAGIKPSPPAPAGGDSEVCLWDPNSGEIWDFFQCSQNVDGTWATNGSGQYICTNFSHYVGEAAGSGSPTGYISRGAGVPYIAGLVRPWEPDQGGTNLGVIRHAIAFAYDTPATTTIYPATKSDGTSSPLTDIPEGTRIKLKDSFPIQDIPDPLARVIATALRDYGGICIDISGNPKMYAEADVSTGLAVNWGGRMVTNLLRDIPLSQYVVVDPNGTSVLREPDVRVDASKPDDPLSTLPAITSMVQGGNYNAGTAIAPPLTTPSITAAADELMVVEVAFRGNNDQFVVGVTGAGVTWKRLLRRMEDRRFSQNLVHEIWWARAPGGGTSGAIAINFSSTVLAIQARVLTFTAGSTIRKFFTRDFASVPTNQALAANATPNTIIRSTTVNSLIVGMLSHRAGTAGAGSGATAVALNDTQGAGGTVIKLSTTSKPGGGDITLAPTLSAATEWMMSAYEVT